MIGFSTDLRTVLPAVADYGVVIDLDAEDLDGDGDRDLVLNRTGSTTFYSGFRAQVLRADGGRAFTDVTATWMPANTATSWVDWLRMQDLEPDGDIDVFADDAARALIWRNDGTGVLTRE